MLQFILGLVLFFGIHSISIFALPLRDKLAAKSQIGWKVFYGVVSLIGLVLISKGYAELRLSPIYLYVTPMWMRHVAALLLLPTFILFFAPYFPGRLNNVVKHPQLASVKLWALSHLLINGTLADVMLFGAFLVWAVVDMISMKKRSARSVQIMRQSNINDIIVVIVGLAVYVAFVLWLHGMLIGVKPFG
ncbi:MAG: NnrU family protein [Pseudomonadales bacterium]|nr:NnrU family protein [Pseudomonadales bacterium]